MNLWVKTTLDKYELPVAVADSAKELAEMVGSTQNSVLSSVSKGRRGWYKIDVEEDEDDGHDNAGESSTGSDQEVGGRKK